MENVFSDSKWIWLKNSRVNQYVDFVRDFAAENIEDLTLRISADSNYAVFINGAYVYGGQYPDYPHYKIYDELAIGKYCKHGRNRLAVLCSYTGEDTSTYCLAEAGLLYEIVGGGRVLAGSDEKTLCREDRCYESGRIEKISPQLGFTYHYDSTFEDGWMNAGENDFTASTVLDKRCTMFPRPVKLLEQRDNRDRTLIAQGEFYVPQKYDTPAETVANCFLRHVDITAAGNAFAPVNRLPQAAGYRLSSAQTGVYVLVDMGRETAGFLSLDFEVPCDATVVAAFGEHLQDLRVRSFIEGRNFAVTYRAKQGRNVWTGLMRRLGCRYVQLYVYAPSLVLFDCKIIGTEYPVKELPVTVRDGLRHKIYENGVHTLRCCMHEHYEDCPWREQALYAMDSRNQMLFGYTVFDNAKYAQANLRLMSKGLRKDGLLELCFPARVAITIPSFNLYFVLAVIENYQFTKDVAFAAEMLPAVQKIVQTFAERRDETGLIPEFSEEPYWNFYEWKPGLDGGLIFRDFRLPVQYSSCLNLLYLLVLQRLPAFCAAVGVTPIGDIAEQELGLRAAIERDFYDEERRLFASVRKNGVLQCYAQLPVALAVVAGCKLQERETLLRALKEDASLVTVSLANKLWMYEALLTEKGNLDCVLRDIDLTFSAMAQKDTTLYETECGANDFALAGSLCHGWAAVACYIYNTAAKGLV